ncbi:hypothetical protein Ancab_007589 [Ancistrocladus abbreviatus]
MEFGSITQFLDGKTILVTGGTGFIAKIFVEKILRVQPNVRRLYLLIRAKDAKSVIERLKKEIIGTELFKVLKEKHGSNFDSFIAEKVTAVAGDASYENLEINDHNLREEMLQEIDVVVNLAATTKFYDRYDVALGINTLGARHVINFTKKCAKIQLLLHVSTAYVCGEKAGLIPETPHYMGETLNGRPDLDIDAEKKLVDETLNDLKAKQTPEKEFKEILRDLGAQRAKLYGWPNSYVFTKAMGEMIVGELKGDLPVVIVRPTIVCSTYKEPFPGWIEGIRTIDTATVAYGKGKLIFLLADRSCVHDMIPADMVVNAMIVAMVAHANRSSPMTIYHVGSSFRNPAVFKDMHEMGFQYFTKNPWINREGKPVKVRKGIVIENVFIFQMVLAVWYFIVVKVLELVDVATLHYFHGIIDNFYIKVKTTVKLVEVYKPFLFFKGIFVDQNTEDLRVAARKNGVDENVFYFDPKDLDWEDYFVNFHIPSIVKTLF